MILDMKYLLRFNTVIALFSGLEMPLQWANVSHLPLGTDSWIHFSSTFEEQINLEGKL